MSQKGLPIDEPFNRITHRRKDKDLQFNRFVYVYKSQNIHEIEMVRLHAYLGRRYKKYLQKFVRETMVTF
jgi:hypothetical protein